jgi:hypothetical protein
LRKPEDPSARCDTLVWPGCVFHHTAPSILAFTPIKQPSCPRVAPSAQPWLLACLGLVANDRSLEEIVPRDSKFLGSCRDVAMECTVQSALGRVPSSVLCADSTTISEWCLGKRFVLLHLGQNMFDHISLSSEDNPAFACFEEVIRQRRLQLTPLTIQHACANNVPVSAFTSTSKEANCLSSQISDAFFQVANLTCLTFFHADGSSSAPVALVPCNRTPKLFVSFAATICLPLFGSALNASNVSFPTVQFFLKLPQLTVPAKAVINVNTNSAKEPDHLASEPPSAISTLCKATLLPMVRFHPPSIFPTQLSSCRSWEAASLKS